MHAKLKRMSPARIIALGFALVILLGSGLLMLPCCLRDGVQLSYIDALYTSTSAVCVTGLVVIDIGDTFSPLGQTIMALLIQIGGLGVATIGAGIILAVGKRMDIKSRTIMKEAGNLSSGRGIVTFVQSIFMTTAIIELLGALLCLPVFMRNYPLGKAIGISLFHSVAAFNNSGFDILGGMQSLTAYRDDVLLNLVTCLLIFFGGIGFLVIRELWAKKCNWKKLSMHAKVVLSVSLCLIVSGTIIFKFTENINWLGALFQSVTARTAGFATYPIGSFTNAGLLAMMILMFIGASSGSTGGGIKTGTFFALLQGIKSAATNKSEKAFRYALPKDAFKKASIITLLSIGVIATATFLFMAFEQTISFSDALFEMISAFGTVGLTTGITPTIGTMAKLLSMIIMYIGRLGPLTVATLWYFSRGERVRFPEGNLSIG